MNPELTLEAALSGLGIRYYHGGDDGYDLSDGPTPEVAGAIGDTFLTVITVKEPQNKVVRLNLRWGLHEGYIFADCKMWDDNEWVDSHVSWASSSSDEIQSAAVLAIERCGKDFLQATGHENMWRDISLATFKRINLPNITPLVISGRATPALSLRGPDGEEIVRYSFRDQTLFRASNRLGADFGTRLERTQRRVMRDHRGLSPLDWESLLKVWIYSDFWHFFSRSLAPRDLKQVWQLVNDSNRELPRHIRVFRDSDFAVGKLPRDALRRFLRS